MAKIVNCWNEWDPLKRVIVGRPEGTNVPAPEPAWWYDLPLGGYPLGSYGSFPQEMVAAANEQMDYFVSVLEKRGVKVDRPVVHPCMFNKPVSTPDWTQLNCYGISNLRDQFLCHGNHIIEGAGCVRARYYEYLNLRPVFEQYFKEDPELVWFTAPKPRLTDESYVRNYYHNFEHVWTMEEKRQRLYNWEFQLTEKEPLWDAANAMRFGKDIFVNCAASTNRSGIDWLKRMFAEFGIRVHHAVFDGHYHPRHIDGSLAPLRPGLAMIDPDGLPRTQELWDLFKKNDWELIPAAVSPPRVHKATVNLGSSPPQPRGNRGGVFPLTPLNTLSLDPKTVFVEAYDVRYCEQLGKLGFEAIPIPYDKVIPFGGILHCTTLDVYRDGTLQDYFPKQIKGY